MSQPSPDAAPSIASMRSSDWRDVRRIYLEGIASGNATFETRTPSWRKWNAQHRREARLVARRGSRVVGWAALTPASSRAVYSGVAEVSVYVADAEHGRGIGRALLEALIGESEAVGVWTLQAGVFPENEASLALHRRCGFRIVGIRKRLGQLHGVWRDVYLLERRGA